MSTAIRIRNRFQSIPVGLSDNDVEIMSTGGTILLCGIDGDAISFMSPGWYIHSIAILDLRKVVDEKELMVAMLRL